MSLQCSGNSCAVSNLQFQQQHSTTETSSFHHLLYIQTSNTNETGLKKETWRDHTKPLHVCSFYFNGGNSTPEFVAGLHLTVKGKKKFTIYLKISLFTVFAAQIILPCSRWALCNLVAGDLLEKKKCYQPFNCGDNITVATQSVNWK